MRMISIKSDVTAMPVKALRSLIATHRNIDSATSSRVGSIIRRKRPSIRINDGSINQEELLTLADEFPNWTQSSTNASEEIIKAYSGSVARLEVKDNLGRHQPIGTCFLVCVDGRVRMATAGHMLLALLGPGNSVKECRPLKARNSMRKARVNFHDTGADDPEHIFEVKEPWVWAHPRWDLLLFDLDTTQEKLNKNKMPLPLELDALWWPEAEANQICVLGYPMNNNNGLNNAFTATFSGELGIKRFSPGLCDQPHSDTRPPEHAIEDVSTIERDRSTIDHDATTLQGSSGSPIFSLHSKKVIGLHYDGGEFHRARHRPPPDPNNAVNIPVALLERQLLADMSDTPTDTNGQAPINWVPKTPGWTGTGSLEFKHWQKLSLLPASDSPIFKSVVADRPDFRDHLYRPSLLKADDVLIPSNKGGRFIRNQADIPACTAFAVAATINVQLRKLGRANEPVSEQMLYAMATLHDEWINDSKGGSSLRGTIKGFYQNGVCLDSAAPLTADGLNWSLSRTAALQARSVTLGAYYRLRPSLLDFQLALSETGSVVVSAHIHSGWTSEQGLRLGKISPHGNHMGTHAFVILGYVQDGFIIQNSWGNQWSNWNGHPGLAHWHYDDWADNLIDAWVLRLAPSAPRAFDLVPKIATQHLLLQSDSAEEIQLPSLPRQRRYSLIGHVCQIERDRFINDGRLGMGLDSLRETSLYLCSDAAQEKYPTIAFFFHDPLLGQDNIGKLCAWMIKPFKRHGIYPIHIVYGIDEARTIKLRVEHECQQIKQRFASVEQDLSIYIERRISQLMQPLIRVFQEGIEDAVAPGNSIWQALASICLENGGDRKYCAFASGIGYRILTQTSELFEMHGCASAQKHGSKTENNRLFEQKLTNLFLLAPSATLEMIDALGIADNTLVCTLAKKYEPLKQLHGYHHDWIDLTARVTGLNAYGTPAIRGEQNGNSSIKLKYEQAHSKTLHEASAEAHVLNACLNMFSEQSFKPVYAFK